MCFANPKNALISLFLLLIAGCASPPSSPSFSNLPYNMDLSSSAFTHEGAIPSEYTCDGNDTIPPLTWTDPPEGTQNFALISDDPDAPNGDWVHWVVYNIPADARSLPGSGIDGTNSWGKTGYGGPCPPSGTHRYFFKLYALDTTLDLNSPTKYDLLSALEGHVLGQAELMGTYERSSQ